MKFTEFLSDSTKNLDEHHYPLFDFGNSEARYSLFTPATRAKFVKTVASKIRMYLKKDFQDPGTIERYTGIISTAMDAYIGVTGSIPEIDERFFLQQAGDWSQDIPPVYSIGSRTLSQLRDLPLTLAVKMGVVPKSFGTNLYGRNDKERTAIAERLMQKYSFRAPGSVTLLGALVWLITSIAFNMEALNSSTVLERYMKQCMNPVYVETDSFEVFYEDFFNEMKEYYGFVRG